MRKFGWEDFALPLALMFAVVFALTLRQGISFSPGEAIAATQQPDYVMTITAKRIPPECRTSRSAACDGYRVGNARMEMHEGNTRLANRAAEGAYTN